MSRKPLTKEQQIAQVRRVQEQRKLEEQRYQEEVNAKAKRFKGPVGILIKGLAVLIILTSIGLLIDDSLGSKTRNFKIYSNTPETVDVISGDGYIYASVFQHLYLDESQDLELFVHQETVQRAMDKGEITLGQTLLFNKVDYFMLPGEAVAYALYDDAFWELTFPIICIFFSLLALVMKPSINMQTIYLAYMNMVLMPLLVIVLGFHVGGTMMDKGYYEMNPNDPDGMIQILDVDTVNE